ncbi:MAG TPA: Uma2 family endonuclease [Longimicrobium sp.]
MTCSAQASKRVTDVSDWPELTFLEELRIGIWSHGIGEHVVVPLGRPATDEDLWLTKFKAEIVDGQMVVIGPTTLGPADAAANIRKSLDDYERSTRGGYQTGAVAFIVDLPHRRSFCPDVGWYTGDPYASEFLLGAPAFAVEIRDPGEEGDEAERRMAAKRADYFAAGTQVVWDVDVLRENLIRAYRANDPGHPTVYRGGETADAEPAVPGWRFPVDELFD